MNTPHAHVELSPEDKAKKGTVVPLSDLDYGDRTGDVLNQAETHPLMHNRHVYGTEDKDGRLVGEGKVSGGLSISEEESNKLIDDKAKNQDQPQERKKSPETVKAGSQSGTKR